MNPAQFRLLLAGPKVSRLHPFFAARGYVADACATGEEALELMRQAPRHVLLVELDLGDLLVADLLDHVRAENLAGAVILLDDPAKSGLIVATLIRGVDGYVATPPDELYLFRLVERQLLAQWALAQGGQSAHGQEKARLEKSLELERNKVKELVKEIASLREELHASRAKPAGPATAADGFDDDIETRAELDQSEPVAVTPNGGVDRAEILDALDDAFDPELDADDFEEETDVGAALTLPKPSQEPIDTLETARTLPARKPAPADLAFARTSPSGVRAPVGLRPGPGGDAGFDDVPRTRPAHAAPRPAPRPPVKAAPVADEPSEDIFLDVGDDDPDDDTSEVAVTPPRGGNRFLLTPDGNED